jgi:hypothetical protein
LYVRGRCGGDHQPNGTYGTPTRGAILSIAREWDFVLGDERSNPRATTIGNYAAKWPREFATLEKGIIPQNEQRFLPQ